MARSVRVGARLAAAGCAAALGAAVPGAPALADGAALPESPLGLVLEAEEVAPGGEAVLRTTVSNSGPEAVEDAHLAQHVAEGLEIVEADGGGLIADGIVNWRVGVPGGEEAVYTVRVRPAEHAGESTASTACLLLEGEDDPTVCASDAVAVTEPAVLSRASGKVDPAMVAGGAGVALAAGTGWLLWRRRVRPV